MAVNLIVPWYANLNDSEDESTIDSWTLPNQEQSLDVSLFKSMARKIKIIKEYIKYINKAEM